MDTVDYRTTKQKIEDAGRYVKRKAREGWEWVKENKDIVLVADDQHRLQLPQIIIASPFPGQLDGSPHEVS